MAFRIGSNSLSAPISPRLKDVDSERVRLEHHEKIRELQTAVRSLSTTLDAVAVDLSRNFTTASQGPGFATDTYVTNSDLRIPKGGIVAGMVFRWMISVSKTAAGVAAATFTFRLGGGSISDTALLALTSGTAQTAAASSGLLVVSLGVRTPGTVGVVAGGVGVASGTAGLGGGVDGVSGSVDLSSAAGRVMGLSINAGAAAAWTITSCTCELIG